jgi:putative heme-binding domain-containing protein
VTRRPGLLAPAVLMLALALGRLVAQNAAQDHSGQYAPADVATGARVYNAMCAGCHGPTGAGVGSVDLRRGPLPHGATDAALSAIITSGNPQSGMPAFRLDPNELRGLVAFIRVGFDANAAATPAATGDVARGRMIFEGRGNCLSCHRVNDKGQYSGPDLTDIGQARTPAAIQRSLVDPTGSMRPINRPVRAVTRDGTVITGRRINEDTYTVQLVTDQGRLVSLVKAELRDWSVSSSSPMPSYKDILRPEELADLVAYLASLKGPFDSRNGGRAQGRPFDSRDDGRAQGRPFDSRDGGRAQGRPFDSRNDGRAQGRPFDSRNGGRAQGRPQP